MARPLSVALSVMLLAAGLLGAGPQTGARAAPASDTLVVAKDISDIRTPDPNKSYDISGVFLQFPIYSRLVKQEAPDLGKILPDVAASW